MKITKNNPKENYVLKDIIKLEDGIIKINSLSKISISGTSKTTLVYNVTIEFPKDTIGFLGNGTVLNKSGLEISNKILSGKLDKLEIGIYNVSRYPETILPKDEIANIVLIKNCTEPKK